MEVLLTVISVAGTIAVAIITGLFSVKMSKIKTDMETETKKAEERTEERKKESLLSMKLASANTKLVIGVAMAIKHGKANGEIEEGLEAVESAQREYDDFLKSIAIKDISK